MEILSQVDDDVVLFSESPQELQLMVEELRTASNKILYNATDREASQAPQVVIHEIGHAIGFHHEQSRSGRNDYVRILLNNIQSGLEGNFRESNTENYGIEYDYVSIMHYGPRSFERVRYAANTIQSVDPLYQYVMGRGQVLSFRDQKAANIAYCLGIIAFFYYISMWSFYMIYRILRSDANNEVPFKNAETCTPADNQDCGIGFLGANCICVCPNGVSGANCQIGQEISTEVPCNELITSPGTYSTPMYPTRAGTWKDNSCAPNGQRARVFFEDFSFNRKSSSVCINDQVEVRVEGANSEVPFDVMDAARDVMDAVRDVIPVACEALLSKMLLLLWLRSIPCFNATATTREALEFSRNEVVCCFAVKKNESSSNPQKQEKALAHQTRGELWLDPRVASLCAEDLKGSTVESTGDEMAHLLQAQLIQAQLIPAQLVQPYLLQAQLIQPNLLRTISTTGPTGSSQPPNPQVVTCGNVASTITLNTGESIEIQSVNYNSGDYPNDHYCTVDVQLFSDYDHHDPLAMI
ncbi:Protein SpAN [Nymphon striatum]|nr:Protein SpAN [Nymphon striatum]